jgi:hypothetical protein
MSSSKDNSSKTDSSHSSYSTVESVNIKSVGDLKNVENMDELLKSNYYTLFNPDCVRKKSNWTIHSNKYKFDDESFDKDLFLNDIERNSPKLNALLKNIEKLDKEDQDKYGKKFKHFIFSDLKSGTYGAKMIASAFIASGFSMGYYAPQRGQIEEVSPSPVIQESNVPVKSPSPQEPSVATTVSTSPPEPSVATTVSTSPPKPSAETTVSTSPPEPSAETTVSVSPPEPSAETTVSTSPPEPSVATTVSTSPPKPSVATTVSTSPQEPSVATTVSTSPPKPSAETTVSTSPPKPSAETTVSTSPPESSSILSNIQNSIGSLFTSTVSTSPPEPSPEENKRPEENTGPEEKKGGKKTAYLNIRLKKDTELLKTTQNNFLLLSSVDVFGKPITVKMKKEILKKFNERPNNVYGEYARFIIMDSGFKEGIDLFDIKYVHIFEPQRTSADQKQVIGRGTRTCGQKGLVFHPTMGWPLYVFNYDIEISNQYSKIFNNASSGIELYLKALQVDLRLLNFANELERISIIGSVDYELNQNIHNFALSKKKSASLSNVQSAGANTRLTRSTEKRLAIANKRATRKRKSIPSNPAITLEPAIQQIMNSYNSEMPIGNHLEMRKHIREHFSKYTWDNVQMENLCGYAGPPDMQKGGAQIINYSPTQDFIKHYFTPNNPIKGMLLWNSVGTGKTCSAIAAASYSFEPEEYTILWVTRTTLKADIWKNMFEQVCNERIRLEIQNGKQIPENHNERMKLLSKSWKIRPMSYKQFSNLVSKQNRYYSDLVKINGEGDPLRKTLLIIDEAHKLYGGTDLSSIEKPDMNALHKALMNSYLVSGKESVKLLLMTATPITESPLELIQLLNLLRLPENQFPDQMDTFTEKYLDTNGLFTPQGQAQFLDDIAGYISYLNREKDARQFSQPIITNITVPIVTEQDKALIDKYDKAYAKGFFESDINTLKSAIEDKAKQIDEELRDNTSSKFLFLKNKCEPHSGIVKKKCEKMVSGYIKDLVAEAKNETKTIREEIKQLREELAKQTKLKTAKMREYVNIGTPEEYKNTLFYNLKNKCGKKINDKTELNRVIQTHPAVFKIEEEMANAEKNILKLEHRIALHMTSSKNRILNIKQLLNTDISDMEKRVLKMVLKEEQNNIRELQAKNKTQKADTAKRLNTTKKHYMKQKRDAIKTITKLLKKNLTEKKKNEKQIKREELKLRKTLRKQNRIQEEMKNEFVKGLVTKYSNKIDEDLKIIESTVTDAEREKEEAKEVKKLEQQIRKLEREQQKELKEKAKKQQQLQKEQAKEAKQKQKEQKEQQKQNKTKRITKIPIKSSLLANVMKKPKPVTKKNIQKIQELKHINNIEDKYDTTAF